jgi:hypothetical protein
MPQSLEEKLFARCGGVCEGPGCGAIHGQRGFQHQHRTHHLETQGAITMAAENGHLLMKIDLSPVHVGPPHKQWHECTDPNHYRMLCLECGHRLACVTFPGGNRLPPPLRPNSHLINPSAEAE